MHEITEEKNRGIDKKMLKKSAQSPVFVVVAGICLLAISAHGPEGVNGNPLKVEPSAVF